MYSQKKFRTLNFELNQYEHMWLVDLDGDSY